MTQAQKATAAVVVTKKQNRAVEIAGGYEWLWQDGTKTVVLFDKIEKEKARPYCHNYGVRQCIQDNGAATKTWQERKAAYQAKIDMLYAGEITKRGESKEVRLLREQAANDTYLEQALAALYPSKDSQKRLAARKAESMDKWRELALNPAVAAKLAEIKAPAASAIDEVNSFLASV